MFKSSIALSLLSASLCSCATLEPKASAARSPEARERVVETAALEVETELSEGTIRISKTIREACGLNQSDAHFRFDSAVIQDADASVLDQVAACFIEGPLAGERMDLIGRADPRGEEQYNVVLGVRRSDAVKLHLVGKGMNGDRISTSSRGELDATGTDEAGWRLDRRVDVTVAPEV